MPELRSAVAPKFRRCKPTGRALVSLGGRRVYLGKYGTKASRAEYERVVGEWTAMGRPAAALQHAADGDGNGCRVNELPLAYLRQATRYYRAGGELGCTKTP